MTHHYLKFLIVAASFYAGSVAAQQQTFDPKQRIPHYSEATIAPVLKDQNASVRNRRSLANGGKVFTLEWPNGMVYNVKFAACDKTQTRCTGLTILGSWRTKKQWTRAQQLEFVSDFNNRYRFSQAGVTDKGRFFLSRYLTADYGTFLGNVRVEFKNFNTLASRFQGEISKASETFPAKQPQPK